MKYFVSFKYMKNDFFIYRMWIIISLLIVTPLGFATKFYIGPGELWFHNYGGAIFYEIFWCLVIFLFTPTSSPLKIAIVVFIATSFLETLQLWHPAFLEWIRKSFIGRTLVGTTFVPCDFFYYVIGCIIGYLWLKTTLRLSGSYCNKSA